MPGMRGEEVMKTIRSKPDGKTVPIFAVTASVFEGNQASLIADGFTAFLVKPFHQNDLLDLIEQKTPIRFVKETFQTNTRKPVVEMATVVEWLKALPEADQLRLVEAIQISDADAVLRLAGVYRAFSSEAEFLCRISEDSNYKKLLELAELLEKENLG
jgi:CheY-like chemotaxis protein